MRSATLAFFAAALASTYAQSQTVSLFACASHDLYVTPPSTVGSPLCPDTPLPGINPATNQDESVGANEIYCQYSKGSTTADCPSTAFTGSTCRYNKTTGEVDAAKSDDTLASTPGDTFCPPAVRAASKRMRARHLARVAQEAQPASL